MALPSVVRRFFGSAVSNAAGYSMGGAIQPTLEPLTQDLANETWRLHPTRPVPPAAAAEATVRGLLDTDAAAHEAAASGYDGERFRVMRGLAGEPPGAQQLLELWNRGEITEADVTHGLQQGRMRPEWYSAFKALRTVLVPVSDLVRMAVREVFSPEQRAALDLDADYPAELTAKARLLGLAEADARDYWAAHWELPSATQGAEMLHRGLISQSQYDGLLRALDYAPTWRDKLRALADRIPPVTDMIRFAVREVYSPDVRSRFGLDEDYPAEFTSEAALNGMSDERARQYWAAHWELPSPEQGFRMYHRKIIDRDTLALLLRTRDYMPFWRGKLIELAYLVPGRVDLRRMFKFGVLTEAQVREGYERLGYSPEDAATLTRFAVAEKAGASAAKDLTAAQLATEYEGLHITRAEYLAALEKLGYTEAEASQLAELADTRRVVQARNQRIGRIHTQYVGHKIATEQARAALDAANVRPEAAELIMAEWDAEREVNVRRLTQAQVKKAFTKALRDRAWALDALTDLGMTDDEAALYLDQ